jgi:hypothetical protein
LLSERCTVADDCLVSCIASEHARDIGSGCWHACFETKFRIQDWVPPPGYESCDRTGRLPGGP